MEKRYTARQAVEEALKHALRYERLGYCRRCEEVHTEAKHLDSINLIAEEVYLWLGFGKERQDLHLFTCIVKTLEDAPVTGRKETDIPLLVDRLLGEMRP
jgi:hypothetical protein